MKKIIWISSYPKSGNTFLRILLSSYFFSSSGIFEQKLLGKIPEFSKDFMNFERDNDPSKEILKWNQIQENIPAMTGNYNFLKTHIANIKIKNEIFSINSKITLGAIYIVRDPRNVVLSIKDHFQVSENESLKFLINKDNCLCTRNNNLSKGYVPILDWESNFLSWENDKRFKTLLIRYEDLILNTEEILLKILKFIKNYIKFNLDEKKIINVINSTKFNKLKKLEKEQGFIEKNSMSIQNNIKPFFNKGVKRNFKEELSDNIINIIEKKYSNTMLKLGYK